jgi:putative transposase
MARLPRLIVPGLPHLVVQRGHNDQAAFADDGDRETYLRLLAAAAPEVGVEIHAYGLQPAEVRLLATPSSDRSLAALMQAVGRRYVRAFNLRHGRRSSPWEGRYRSTVVEPGPDVITSVLVVDSLASATQGFAGGSEPPRWTSAAHHLGIRRDGLITDHPVFWLLGNTPFEREAAYRSRFEQGLSAAESRRVLDAALGGWALASKEFAAQLGVERGRRAHPLPRGRPAAARTTLNMSPIK